MKFTASVVLRAIALFILLECTGRVERAAGASIALFSTQDCSSCNLTAHIGQQATFHVSAPISGLDLESLGFADFRISGVPPEWFVLSIVPGPGVSVVTGSPLGVPGVRCIFTERPTSLCTTMLSITLIATSEVQELRFRVEGWDPPVVPSLNCPVLVVCEPFCDSFVCVDGGVLLVNSTATCQVDVEASTWSVVKEFYR